MPQIVPFYFINPDFFDIKTWSLYVFDNIKNINNTDFLSFIKNLNYIFLCTIMFVLAILILYKKKISARERRKLVRQLKTWEFTSIPQHRKFDLFYLKLGAQSIKNSWRSDPKSIYHPEHTWARLTPDEINRLHRAALHAESTGTLWRNGYIFNRIHSRLDLNNRIVLAKHPQTLARTNLDFIQMISTHDFT